jgi:hypothetical protein
MENRQYMIFNASEAGLIDFNEVLQTSAETLRKSNDNSKTFVKWESKMITNSTDALPFIPALDENGEISGLESTPHVEPTIEAYIPASVNALTTKEGPYTHTEILSILSGSEWKSSITA